MLRVLSVWSGDVGFEEVGGGRGRGVASSCLTSLSPSLSLSLCFLWVGCVCVMFASPSEKEWGKGEQARLAAERVITYRVRV